MSTSSIKAQNNDFKVCRIEEISSRKAMTKRKILARRTAFTSRVMRMIRKAGRFEKPDQLPPEESWHAFELTGVTEIDKCWKQNAFNVLVHCLFPYACMNVFIHSCIFKSMHVFLSIDLFGCASIRLCVYWCVHLCFSVIMCVCMQFWIH